MMVMMTMMMFLMMIDNGFDADEDDVDHDGDDDDEDEDDDDVYDVYAHDNCHQDDDDDDKCCHQNDGASGSFTSHPPTRRLRSSALPVTSSCINIQGSRSKHYALLL